MHGWDSTFNHYYVLFLINWYVWRNSKHQVCESLHPYTLRPQGQIQVMWFTNHLYNHSHTFCDQNNRLTGGQVKCSCNTDSSAYTCTSPWHNQVIYKCCICCNASDCVSFSIFLFNRPLQSWLGFCDLFSWIFQKLDTISFELSYIFYDLVLNKKARSPKIKLCVTYLRKSI